MIEVFLVIAASISLASSVYILIQTIISEKKEIDRNDQLLSAIRMKGNSGYYKVRAFKRRQDIPKTAKLTVRRRKRRLIKFEGLNLENEPFEFNDDYMVRGSIMDGFDVDKLQSICKKPISKIDMEKDNDNMNEAEYRNPKNVRKVVSNDAQDGKPDETE